MQCVHTNTMIQNFVFDETNDNSEVPDEECDICLEPLSDQQCVILNSCEHVFHEKCYFEHAKTQRQQGLQITCPYCRMEPENVWKLARGEVQHASRIHRPQIHDGYGLDEYTMEFLTDLCKREDFTFASPSENTNQIYQDRYKKLVDRVYNELQMLQLHGLSAQQLVDYTHHIIQEFEDLENSITSQKYQHANILFKQHSYEEYKQSLQEISLGNVWPKALYGHMQLIHATYPMLVPNVETFGIDPSTAMPLLQHDHINIPVVDKGTKNMCIQILIEALEYTIRNMPISSRTRSQHA